MKKIPQILALLCLICLPACHKTSAPTVADGVKYTALFPDGPQGEFIVFPEADQATLEYGDKSYALYLVRSASGARYANDKENVVFWTKGDGAMLEMDGRMVARDIRLIKE